MSVNIDTADYYLFAFDLNLGQKILLATVNETNARNTVFDITEKADEDLANSVISIPEAGEYLFSIYGSPSSDLTLPDADPLYTGWCKVYRDSQTNTSYSITETKVAYDPRA